MIALALACIGLGPAGPPTPDEARPPVVAALTAPTDPREAGLRGLIDDRGRWVSPDRVVERDRDDARLAALLAEYADRRSRAPGTAKGQRDLATWCDRVGLSAEAVAHFTAVTRLDPEDAEARQRLGYQLHQGRWMTDAEVAAEAAEVEAQARADRQWGPRIAAWRWRLTEPGHRDEAARALAGLRDPRAIPALLGSFGGRTPWEQGWAIKLLGQIDSPRSSQALAELSVFGIDETVRAAALRPLARRDLRAFAGMLINWLHDPVAYQFVATPGRGGGATLRVEGEAAIVERTYRASPRAGSAPLPRDEPITLFRSDGRPQTLFQRASRAEPNAGGAARAVLERRAADARAIDRSNVSIELTNERVERALVAVTGVDLGQDRQPWAAWLTSEMGYSYESPPPPIAKPIVSEQVAVPVKPVPPTYSIAQPRHSCFGAGTPVYSRGGPRPIEELRVGDQVLSQDPASGELGFRPILAVFHNRPAATLKVGLGGESIVATPIHRFWLAGRGWAMARDLRPGDRVRTLGGLAEVSTVTRDEVRPVFNLEVAGGHSFFVGQKRALVHDHSIVDPSTEVFDARVTAARGPAR